MSIPINQYRPLVISAFLSDKSDVEWDEFARLTYGVWQNENITQRTVRIFDAIDNEEPIAPLLGDDPKAMDLAILLLAKNKLDKETRRNLLILFIDALQRESGLTSDDFICLVDGGTGILFKAKGKAS